MGRGTKVEIKSLTCDKISEYSAIDYERIVQKDIVDVISQFNGRGQNVSGTLPFLEAMSSPDLLGIMRKEF